MPRTLGEEKTPCSIQILSHFLAESQFTQRPWHCAGLPWKADSFGILGKQTQPRNVHTNLSQQSWEQQRGRSRSWSSRWVEEACLCSVLEDKGAGWLRRSDGPPDRALSLAVPTLLQHKLLVHLMMAPEVQGGPWQRVLGYGGGAFWTLGQPT